MKMFALAAVAVLFTVPATAQTLQTSITISKGVPNGQAGTFIGSTSNGVIDTYQANSPGIPAGTNQQIDAFQTTFTTGAASVNAANPAPNVGVPFTIHFSTPALPLAK